MSDPSTPYRPRCKNLFCKAMLVYGEGFENDPDYQAGMAEFWCVRTSKGQGPDGDGVSMTECTNSERGCYEAY